MMRPKLMLEHDTRRNRATTQQSLEVITGEAEGEDPTGSGHIEGVYDALI